jgi:hypothetical protein
MPPGYIKSAISPLNPPVRDLEGVRLLVGGSGELDKRADPKLSHISDALGYYIQQQFPTIRQHATVQDLLIS